MFHRVSGIENQILLLFSAGRLFVRAFGGTVSSFGHFNTPAKRRIVFRWCPLFNLSQGVRLNQKDRSHPQEEETRQPHMGSNFMISFFMLSLQRLFAPSNTTSKIKITILQKNLFTLPDSPHLHLVL